MRTMLVGPPKLVAFLCGVGCWGWMTRASKQGQVRTGGKVIENKKREDSYLVSDEYIHCWNQTHYSPCISIRDERRRGR